MSEEPKADDREAVEDDWRSTIDNTENAERRERERELKYGSKSQPKGGWGSALGGFGIGLSID